MSSLSQVTQPVNTRLWGGAPVLTLDSETFATVEAGVVNLHRGQRTGSDSDWGGACIASLSLEQALAIAEAVRALQSSDPALAAWEADGAPTSGATWSGDYSDCYGSDYPRLTVASN